MRIRVLVNLKNGVLDPQGQTVRHALHVLGYHQIKDVRQGKVFEIELENCDRETASKLIPEIADKVLANPIIETFSWDFLD